MVIADVCLRVIAPNALIRLWQNQRKVRVVVGSRGGNRRGFLSVLPESGQNRRAGAIVTHKSSVEAFPHPVI